MTQLEAQDIRFLWHMPERLAKTRALLVGVYKNTSDRPVILEHLQELRLLAETQNIPIQSEMCFPIRQMTAATFLTQGKLDTVGEKIAEEGINLLIFDDEITPSQQRNLEGLFKIPVIDRTEVILGVFAMRAKSREAKLQVELAEVKYMVPRLKRLWTHLSRQSGGGGGASGGGYLKGEGEKQIEIDRRLLKKRIERLEKEIEEIRLYRDTQRIQRVRTGIPVIAIVGYTNAGKSTLMNLLTDANVYVEDKLFATLDTTTRKYTLKNNQEVLFVDTVGFIRKLPHLLVAAFKSTLEEAIYSDLILHVIDTSHPNAFGQAETTLSVLDELKTHDTPILTVINKIDRIEEPKVRETFQKLRFKYPRAKEISAREKQGIDELEEEIIHRLKDRRTKIKVCIPQKEYHLLAHAIRQGKVLRQEYEENDVVVELEVPTDQVHLFTPYKM